MAAAGKYHVSVAGGIQDCYLHQILPGLEILCRSEESEREKAVEFLCKIGIGVNESTMVEQFLPIIKRLAGDNLASARVSACTLLFLPYQTASMSSKVELRSAYAAFCRDVDPLVRREAASNLWKIAVVDYAHFDHDVMSLLEHLAQDDADESVRSAALQSCGVLRDLLQPPVFLGHILPLIVAGCKDTSLRVREMALNQMHHLWEAGIEDSLPLLQAKTTFAIPIPTFQSVLGVIAVGALVYGTYHGVSSLKELVESIKTNGKEAVGQLKMARETLSAKDCQAFIDVYLWKRK